MASATAKPQKRLEEFLKEQQEPFILEVYLLERGCSKKWSSNGDSGKSLEKSASSGLIKRRKALLPFSKVVKALHKKLAFHNQSSTLISDTDNRKESVNVSVPYEAGSVDQTVVETDRFSTASSSTLFNSCSDIDEDGTSLSSHKDKHLFSPYTCNIGAQSQQATNNGKQRHRCIEVCATHETLTKDVSGCCGVLMPKKITEDSLLSAALWSSLIQSSKRENYTMELRDLLGPNVSQVLKSSRVLHKTKQLLFDCVREIAMNLPKKDDKQQVYKQILGPEELGKVLWKRTKDWGQHAADETNLTYLLTLDYLDSINEWSKFKRQVKDISVQIADAILDRVNSEIVSEMIELLPPTNHITTSFRF
ncbi:uncharacterized protein LOC133314558 [Gastrolobium bilobum]|uniref:uncharacterized protein LOC133314558 n=1 Tax=Gastrolobium bilobum TaxID=150636 RepID=UPI002AAFAF6E|nr:uncharacterized protein LOC133314558 [Gastrolobium bilobum]